MKNTKTKLNKNYKKLVMHLLKNNYDIVFSKHKSNITKTRSIYLPINKVDGKVWDIRISDHKKSHYSETPFQITVDYGTYVDPTYTKRMGRFYDSYEWKELHKKYKKQKINFKKFEKELQEKIREVTEKVQYIRLQGRTKEGRKLNKELKGLNKTLISLITHKQYNYITSNSKYVYGNLEEKIEVIKDAIAIVEKGEADKWN